MTHQHHISRKELLKDDFRETLVHGAETALTHQRMLLWGGLALVVALGLFFGWRFYSERQTVKAAAALEEAQKVFQARIRPMNEPEQPGEITYVDEKNRHEDAAKRFAGVAQNYPGTRPGLVARYYAGLATERLGRHDEALKWYTEVERGGNAELASLARLGRARILEKTNKGDDAVKVYQELISNPTTVASKPFVMLLLADYYRKSNLQEAQKLYTQIRTEFPDSEVAQAAEERLETLGPKS